ncbi:MAG TPA: hypothetical protein ENI27_09785 [bacterium]|nr:hypothetical protein [bacterium]
MMNPNRSEHERFFSELEGFYGKYNRVFLRNTMQRYIKTIPFAELQPLITQLVHTVSNQYGIQPDIVTIAKARKEIEVPHYHAKKLPDPAARAMPLKVGQLMEVVLEKVRLNKKREGRE